MNLYLFQGLPEDQFACANVLVRKKCPNLIQVELGGEVFFKQFFSPFLSFYLGGEVGGDGGDDVAHGEAAGVELVKDLLPVALQVAPCRKSTCAKRLKRTSN